MAKLRIATWNLDHASNGSRPKNLQISQVLKFAPDILILTETSIQVDLSPHGYQVIYPKTKNKYGKYWSSIWFNKNTQLIKEIETANDEVAVCAQFETPIGKLIVYGTIIAYKDYLIKEGSKPWEEHYKSIQWHGEDWFSIISENPNVPFVVAGDYNQTRDGSNRYSTVEGIKLLSTVLEKCKLECVTEENFGKTGKLNTDPGKGCPRANIDHICISKNFFNDIDVGAWDHFNDARKYTSDHNGVFIDLN